MITSIIALLIVSARTGAINAIENTYPFQIDYILFAFQLNILDNAASGTHQINFITPLVNNPSKVLISINRCDFVNTANSFIKYSFLANQISQTGFQLTSQVNTSIYKTILLSYLVTFDNFGVEIQQLTLPAFTKIPGTGTYQANISTSLITSSNNSSDYFINSYLQGADINNYYYLVPSSFQFSFISPGLFNFSIIIGAGPVVNSINVGIFIINYTLFNQKTSQFQGYSLIGSAASVSSTSIRQITTCTDLSCTLLAMVGIKKASLGMLFVFSAADTGTVPGTYNITYMRSQTQNIITLRITTSIQSEFTYILLSRTSCAGQYLYLMAKTQMCYEKCPQNYYPGISPGNLNKCLLCSQCSTIDNCPGCLTSICSISEYLNLQTFPGTIQCLSCSSIDPNCESCLNATCTKCTSASKTILQNSSCLACAQSFYFSNDTCKECPSRCNTCQNETYCTSCISSFVLQSNKCIIGLVTYTSNLIATANFDNKIQIMLNFSGNIYQVLQYYSFLMSVNGQTLDFSTGSSANDRFKVSYTLNQNTNQMEINLEYFESITKPLIKVLLSNKTEENFVTATPVQYQMKNAYFLPEADQQQIQLVEDISDALAENIKYAFIGTSVMSKGLSAVLKILWTAQLSSIYGFMKITLPQKLEMVLHSMHSLLDLQIIPFNIPDISFDEQIQIKIDPIYTQNQIDPYFVRNNNGNFLEVVVYSVFFTVLYLIGSSIKVTNVYKKFLKSKLTHKFYCNFIMSFYAILISTAFTAAVTLTSRSYTNRTVTLNAFCAGFGLCCAFLFCGIHCSILNLLKYKRNVDTKQCYFGLLKSRSKSQIFLFLFLLNQLLIAVLIPLCNPLFALISIILLKIFSFIVLVQSNCLQKKFLLIFRSLALLCELGFNLLFVIYLIIDNHFPGTTVNDMENLGNASFVFLIGTIIAELLQSITDIATDIFQFLKRKYLRTMINKDVENVQEAICKESVKKASSQNDSDMSKYDIGGKREQSEVCFNNSSNSNSPPEPEHEPEPDPIFSRKIDFSIDKGDSTKSAAECKFQFKQNKSITEQKKDDSPYIRRGLKKTIHHKHLSQITLDTLFNIKPRCPKNTMVIQLNYPKNLVNQDSQCDQERH